MTRPNFLDTPEDFQVKVYTGCHQIIMDVIHDVVRELKTAKATHRDLAAVLEMVMETVAKEYGRGLK